MISALLTKIGNLLEKEFLFGSFLPAIIFAAAVVFTLAGIVGFESALAWAGQRGPADKVLYPLVGGVALVVFAYVLSGLRPLILRFWSGEVLPLGKSWLGNVMKAYARRDFLGQRAASQEPNRWNGMEEWLRQKALPLWTNSTTKATPADVKAALAALDPLNRDWSRANVETLVNHEFLARLWRFEGDSMGDVYERLKRLFLDWREQEQQRIAAIQWSLGRSFGSLAHIRATHLGNLIESYTAYSYSRYGIEPDVFWPHLQTQIEAAFGSALSDARTMLDFALNVVTLGTAYALLCMFVGPWLDFSPIWLELTSAGVLCAVAGYKVALVAADQFGGLFRASFDLYRLKLLVALRRESPKTLFAERKTWKELSQLVLFGHSSDFEWTVGAK